MKREFWVWVLVVVIGLGWVGCQSKQGASNHPKPSLVVIELWTLQLKPFASVLVPMMRSFEQAHPGVTVRWVDVPFAQGERRTLAALLSPSVPDVINLNPDFAALLAYRGALHNMNHWVSASQKATYLPAAWQAASMWLPQQPNAITFGIPWYLTSSITLANGAVLKNNPIPQSVGQVAQLAHHFRSESLETSKQSAYLAMPNLTQSGNGLKALFQAGLIDETDPSALQIQLANPKVAAWIGTWVELYQQGLIPAEAVTEGPQAAVDRYQSGSLAIMATGANFLTTVKDNAPQVYANTRLAPQFLAKPNRRGFSEMLLVVPRQSRHPQLAVALALHLTNATNQLALAQAAPVLPSIQSALGHPMFQTTATPLEAARQLSVAQLRSVTQVLPVQPRQKDLNALSDRAFQSALLGTMSVADAIKQWQNGLQTLQP
ncbi:MAG: extracellular solute-binding protein [Vampirovibrionales bacterium]